MENKVTVTLDSEEYISLVNAKKTLNEKFEVALEGKSYAILDFGIDKSFGRYKVQVFPSDEKIIEAYENRIRQIQEEHVNKINYMEKVFVDEQLKKNDIYSELKYIQNKMNERFNEFLNLENKYKYLEKKYKKNMKSSIVVFILLLLGIISQILYSI